MGVGVSVMIVMRLCMGMTGQGSTEPWDVRELWRAEVSRGDAREVLYRGSLCEAMRVRCAQ